MSDVEVFSGLLALAGIEARLYEGHRALVMYGPMPGSRYAWHAYFDYATGAMSGMPYHSMTVEQLDAEAAK